MYRIKIDYRTGNSFHTETTFTYLEGAFEKMATVEENIERIKNHYEFYEKHSDMWRKPEEKLPKGAVWIEEHHHIVLETIDDDGNVFTEWPNWVGYFESIIEVSVETDFPKWSPR